MAVVLEGIKVLDLSQVAAVPVAARHLADFGAEVVHIEHPTRGDSWRWFQAGAGGGTAGVESDINYNWEIYNRNKRSLALDVSQEAGQKVLYELVKTADVFVTNFRPYELEKYRLTYKTLSGLNPRLVFGALTAYGKKGDDRDLPGYDLTSYWYRAGTPYLLTWPGQQPPIFRSALGDHVTGLALALGVMMALFAREKTGVGQELDLSLFHLGCYANAFDIAGALTTGRDYAEWRPNSREDALNPLSNVYRTKDGRWLVISMLQSDKYWPAFCKAIEREDLEHNPRFDSFDLRKQHHVELFHLLEEVFGGRDLVEWRERLRQAGLAHSPMQNLLEVVNDPQAKANDFFPYFDHPTYGRIRVIASPVNLRGTPATLRSPAPELGQHTEEVLLEAGYDWDAITELRERGVI